MVVAVLWKPTFRLTQTEQKKEKENTRTSQSVNVTQSLSPLGLAGGVATAQPTPVSYTWLGTRSFCNPDADLDDAIPENCFALIAHFISHSCWQASGRLFFPVWFSTNQPVLQPVACASCAPEL